ncbi:MAG: ribonuclease H-like domain-containing protein [Planctomycetaceae bacterium]|nr:ribonuclease H-like domain-containing protein [Planctomycetaceae bacterium]
MADAQRVAYLVFDIEAVGDGALIKQLRYPKDDLTPKQAIRRYRDELLEKTGKDVLPPTFVLPASVTIAKVAPDFRLIDLVVLDEPQFRPAVMVKHFWAGWRAYGRPRLVTFNGRGYDLPVLELAAFRYGYAVPEWFNVNAPSYEQSRNRYNSRSHIDLCDFFSNFSAVRLTGGLNLIANLIGKPGKTGVDGSMVQDMFDNGDVKLVNDYCRGDVLDTYFVFLRSRVLMGELELDEEQAIVEETRQWLEERQDGQPAYKQYLEHWGDWNPPEFD